MNTNQVFKNVYDVCKEYRIELTLSKFNFPILNTFLYYNGVLDETTYKPFMNNLSYEDIEKTIGFVNKVKILFQTRRKFVYLIFGSDCILLIGETGAIDINYDEKNVNLKKLILKIIGLESVEELKSCCICFSEEKKIGCMVCKKCFNVWCPDCDKQLSSCPFCRTEW